MTGLTRLSQVQGLTIQRDVPLAGYTRFDIGGPAQYLIDAETPEALAEATAAIRGSGLLSTVAGGGSNLLVSDTGFEGAVLRYTGHTIVFDGARIEVGAGIALQDLVDESIAYGLQGLQTMTGIPGWVGGAIYGNAGAYGHSIDELVESVRFFDGERIREISNRKCEFEYRESIFKRNKNWIILSAALGMKEGDSAELAAAAGDIRKIRDAKYPPTMRCAGSIFKNFLLRNLPERLDIPPTVIREGKVPSAFFLEQCGAKGMTNGPVRVADYHANLIYNTGGGTSQQVRSLIDELKRRVRERFQIELEEEVQYI